MKTWTGQCFPAVATCSSLDRRVRTALAEQGLPVPSALEQTPAGFSRGLLSGGVWCRAQADVLCCFIPRCARRVDKFLYNPTRSPQRYGFLSRPVSQDVFFCPCLTPTDQRSWQGLSRGSAHLRFKCLITVDDTPSTDLVDTSAPRPQPAVSLFFSSRDTLTISLTCQPAPSVDVPELACPSRQLLVDFLQTQSLSWVPSVTGALHLLRVAPDAFVSGTGCACRVHWIDAPLPSAAAPQPLINSEIAQVPRPDGPLLLRMVRPPCGFRDGWVFPLNA